MARWSATHPWRAISLWLVFIALCYGLGSIAGFQKSTADGEVGESGRASLLVDEGHFNDPATENILITARTGALDPVTAKSAADDAITRMRTRADVAKVDGPVPARDGQALLVVVTMAGDPKTASDRVQPLRAVTADIQKAHQDVRVEQTGGPSINKALKETLGNDFKKAELLSLPATLIVLLVAFGALIAAGVPVILAMSSVAGALGLSNLASHLIPGNDSTSSVILLIGMAVGVDYSLFYLRREREERARGRSHLDAVSLAAETSGHAVVVSGIAVVVAMAGLFLARDSIFSSFAIGSILVVLVAVIGSLTVLPAILAKLGPWVDKLRVPVLWRLTARQSTGRGGEPKLWPALLRPALRAPLATLVISVVALLALAAPALNMKLKLPGDEDLPRTTAAMQAYDRLTAAFPSTGTTHLIAVKAPADRAAEVKAALGDLARRASADKLFAVDDRLDIRTSTDGRITTVELATPYAGRSAEAGRALGLLRRDLAPATIGKVPGAEYAVGGFVAASVDYAQHVKEKLPIVIGFVLLLTFLVMAYTFRSIVIAVTAIGLNLLSAGAAYGLVTLVFQGTWAEGLLGFRSIDGIVSWLPLFLFVVLFGLSMDYHVFVVSRIREAARRGMPTRFAVAHGITTSAGTVTSAALVMVAVFSIFGTLSAIEMKQLGVGLGAAILLDATVIRAVVLPSLMTLLGKANWWAPRLLRRPADGGAQSASPAPVEPRPELTPVG
ncbi:MMPL family transporter [Planosporangium flavigriseum]|uniref:Membrane protein n=2 Tax=Planosporangium flavigriseum TaxID=373681 RepID=A0A8J3LPE8_9ACTN|nr:MMPL family transporter [Planosporangium flavigriseum]GIG75427.1 membrane protein [Planosporangium flavigriseum]